MYKNIKRGLLQLLAAAILAGALGNTSTALAKAAEDIVDTSEIENGIIIINSQIEDVKVDKVRVVKDKIVYTYDYKNSMRIPLQSGNGAYQVLLYSHVNGTQYKQAATETVDYSTDDGLTVYLQSSQSVNWNSGMKAIKKAEELTKALKTDSEKVAAIYNYIVNNYEYNYEKARTVTSGYIPAIDDVYNSKMGICYDYSVLFAAMLRSAGIPAKVLMGTSKDVDGYHAWNQVYVDEEWITVDTTLDAGLGKTDQKTMEKKANRYTIEKQY
jgi:transglutaminase-like putative cysteine protease